MNTNQFRLAPDLPQRNCHLSRGNGCIPSAFTNVQCVEAGTEGLIANYEKAAVVAGIVAVFD
jgi:hypothetical protein